MSHANQPSSDENPFASPEAGVSDSPQEESGRSVNILKAVFFGFLGLVMLGIVAFAGLAMAYAVATNSSIPATRNWQVALPCLAIFVVLGLTMLNSARNRLKRKEREAAAE